MSNKKLICPKCKCNKYFHEPQNIYVCFDCGYTEKMHLVKKQQETIISKENLEIKQIKESINLDKYVISVKCNEVKNLREEIKQKEKRIEDIENKLLFNN